MVLNRTYLELERQDTTIRTRGVLELLNGGSPVSIQGPSGSGKTSTVRALRAEFMGRGRRTVYLDMRHVLDRFDLLRRVASQLDLEDATARSIGGSLDTGDKVLFLDEVWAGGDMAADLWAYAHRKGNFIVATAGIPPARRRLD